MFSLATLLALLSSGGVIAYALLAVFAPGILAIITPVITNLVEGLAEVVRRLWRGLVYLFADFNGVLVLLAACLATYMFTHQQVEKKVVKKLHKDYTFVQKKKPATSFIDSFKLNKWQH